MITLASVRFLSLIFNSFLTLLTCYIKLSLLWLSSSIVS
nr:MAG TPA: hypothetical protein [Caudoviricetes sp.]